MKYARIVDIIAQVKQYFVPKDYEKIKTHYKKGFRYGGKYCLETY
jgi:hypothetical protein